MSLLETRNLNKHFGGLHVTADVNFTVKPGEIHCLIGPNGAGKSTFFRLVLGEHRPSSGQIFFADQDITALKPFERIRRGMSVKFQVPGIFSALSVRQNVEIALQHHVEPAVLDREVDRVLTFLKLEPVASQQAGFKVGGRAGGPAGGALGPQGPQGPGSRFGGWAFKIRSRPCT